jgi:hypothetical protein
MRSALLATVVFISAVGASSEPPQGRDPFVSPALRPLSVLFVGNSLTYVNDVPSLTQSLAASSAIHTRLTVYSVTSSGAPLAEHWRKGEAVRVLRARRPDVLIIQGQSTEPLTAAADFARYAQLLKAEADSVGTRTILFQTWARPPGDTFYSSSDSGGSPAAMQARLNQAYESLAQRLRVEVARVGEAFSLVQRQSPDMPLLDGTQHPTLAGSYLAAAVIFQSLHRCSPVDATFTAGLPDTAVSTLQVAAAAVSSRAP